MEGKPYHCLFSRNHLTALVIGTVTLLLSTIRNFDDLSWSIIPPNCEDLFHTGQLLGTFGATPDPTLAAPADSTLQSLK